MSIDVLLDAALDKQAGSYQTLVVRNHLTQICTFMLKSGLRFYPLQDGPLKQRQKFLDALLLKNKISQYLWGISELFLGSGGILWYLRPKGWDGYEIHWYRGGPKQNPHTQYSVIYKSGGRELSYVVIRYPYEVEDDPIQAPTMPNRDRKLWVRLTLTAAYVREETFRQQPSLELRDNGLSHLGMQAPLETKVLINSLGFIPCAVSTNDPHYPGDSGQHDFTAIEHQLETEDQLRNAIVDNCFNFSTSTLVTTRDRDSVFSEWLTSDLDTTKPQRFGRNWASKNGFYGTQNASPSGAIPFIQTQSFSQPRQRSGVPPVIGRVREDERFGYISPDPINADIWRFTQEYRESLHQALGGIDPLSYRYTDWQSLRGLVGQVEVIAKRKCNALFNFGLCEVLRLAIYAEEQLFLTSYKQYLSPILKLIPQVITDEQVMADFYAQQQTPPGILGIAPYGDRSVSWQWLGPLFEPDAREKQVATINARNLQEAGVGSIDALRELFPGKTDKEIQAMLTGVPLRYAQQVSSTLQQLLTLQQTLWNTPDPTNPGIPMGQTIDLSGLVRGLIDNFSSQINQSNRYDPTDPNNEPLPNQNRLTQELKPDDSPILAATPTGPDFSSGLPVVGGTIHRSTNGGLPGTAASADASGFGGQPLEPNGGASPAGSVPGYLSTLLYAPNAAPGLYPWLYPPTVPPATNARKPAAPRS